MLLKKDFDEVGRAILIQERHVTGNIDPKNRLLGVKNCTLVGRPLECSVDRRVTRTYLKIA
jgi:hypothetical protein